MVHSIMLALLTIAFSFKEIDPFGLGRALEKVGRILNSSDSFLTRESAFSSETHRDPSARFFPLSWELGESCFSLKPSIPFPSSAPFQGILNL